MASQDNRLHVKKPGLTLLDRQPRVMQTVSSLGFADDQIVNKTHGCLQCRMLNWLGPHHHLWVLPYLKMKVTYLPLLAYLSDLSLGFSALGVTRTRGPLLRKQVLYPLSYEGV